VTECSHIARAAARMIEVLDGARLGLLPPTWKVLAVSQHGQASRAILRPRVQETVAVNQVARLELAVMDDGAVWNARTCDNSRWQAEP
jgi:hypothetical protein